MKKQKRHLFMDFDGLKYNTFPYFTKYYNNKYGIKNSLNMYLNRTSKYKIPDIEISYEATQ